MAYKANKPTVKEYYSAFKQFGVEKYSYINDTFNNNKFAIGLVKGTNKLKLGKTSYNIISNVFSPTSKTQKESKRMYINNYSNMQFVDSYVSLRGEVA